MEKNRLQVIAVSEAAPSKTFSSNTSREEKIAKLERMWLRDAKQFDPNRNAMERLRLKRTLELILRRRTLNEMEVVDLGCAAGTFTRILRDKGAKVTALDAAANALKLLEEHDMTAIEAVQDCLPHTRLSEEKYDLVVGMDVIAYLNPAEFRLFFAELSRLVKKGGNIVCSTPFARHTEGGLEQFNALVETEIQVEEWSLSYHRLARALLGFLEAPALYAKASKDRELQGEELAKRRSLSQRWFHFQTRSPVAFFWRLISLITSPIARAIQQSTSIILFLEKISRLLWDTEGITHATLIGKQRPLVLPPPPRQLPRETKQKRFVWE